MQGVFAVPVMDEIPRQVIADHRQVAKLLGYPGLVWGGGDVPVYDPPGADLPVEDDAVDLQRRAGDRAEVTSPDEPPVMAEELQPGHPRLPAAFGSEPVLVQDALDAGAAEAEKAQLAHLPGDLAIAHPPVLPGDPQHQLLHLRGDLRRTAWLPPGQQPPVSPDDRTVPSHQRLGLHDHQGLC